MSMFHSDYNDIYSCALTNPIPIMSTFNSFNKHENRFNTDNNNQNYNISL